MAPASSMQRRFLLLVGAVGVATGCLLSVEPFTPTTCQSDADCQPVGDRAFRCVPAADGTRLCEAAFPYTQRPTADGGVPDAGGGGGATYCADIRAMMTRYCISCHTESSNVSGKSTFFLDKYPERTLPDGGTVLGVYDYRDPIKLRMIDERGKPLQMPPQSFPLQPTAAELEALTAWAEAGGPYAATSATYDATAPCVSYAEEIQPIWDAKCVSCHPDFLTPPSQADVVSVDAVCPAPAPKRIVPGQPENSELWRRLVDDAGVRCGPGGKMPQGGAALGASDLELIRSWILEGATNN